MPDRTPIESQSDAQQLRSVSDAAIESYCLFDGAGVLRGWNQALECEIPELFRHIEPNMGYEQFLRISLATNCSDQVRNENDDIAESEFSQLLASKNLEFKLYLADCRWIRMSRIDIQGVGWLLVFRDITKLKQDREALVLSEEKFKRFARLASNWFWELDENLCYLYHSAHEGAMFTHDITSVAGLSRIESLIGKTNDNDQLREHNACLLARESVNVILSWNGVGSGKTTYSHVRAEPRYNSRGEFIGYIGCGRNVTASYQMSAKYEYQANHDYLTGLKNRRALESYLECISESNRLADTDNVSNAESNNNLYTLLSIDLDRFKLINDDAGHAAGDQLLVQVSKLLNSTIGDSGFVARIGGDEFGVCLSLGIEEAEILVDKILDQIYHYSFEWENRQFSIGASVGIAAFNPTLMNSSILMKNADAACYSAKMLGRNRKEVFSKNNHFQAQQSAELETLRTLRSAMDNDRLELYLQPIVTAVSDDQIDKYEVLLRVIDENGSIVYPGDFIPTAEKYDVMQQIDLVVVEKSIGEIKKFFYQGADVSFAINLSGNTLGSEYCLQKIVALVKEQPLPANSLCFEITETAVIKSLETVGAFMTDLRQCGCQFALDDFGSGLSSYGYLESLDVDYIKIDGSFIKKITSEKVSQAIVKSINTLSHEMGMKTVAEFVESKEIADSAIEMKIDYLQGYHYGKPTSISEVLDLYTLPCKRTGTM